MENKEYVKIPDKDPIEFLMDRFSEDGLMEPDEFEEYLKMKRKRRDAKKGMN